MSTIPNVVAIAGVDPSGGAGLLADVKTISALGGYAMGVVTALTAQNTQTVAGFVPVEPTFVTRQLDVLLDDITPDAVKIGMLANAEIIAAVHTFLQKLPAITHVVLDPVMVATSGDALLAPDAVTAIRALLPHVSLITPNIPEAATLLATAPARTVADMETHAQQLRELGAKRVLVKAGHLSDTNTATDVLVTADSIVHVSAEWVATNNTHGTGCTLSSAVATLRPQCDDWPETVRTAKQWLTAALRHSSELGVGQGHGPVHHMWGLHR